MSILDKTYKLRVRDALIFLVSISLIIIVVFYWGYKTGKNSVLIKKASVSNSSDDVLTEEIKLEDLNKKENTDSNQNIIDDKTSISEELNLHDPNLTKTKPETKAAEKVKTKIINKSSVKEFYTIQVGAFSVYKNAKNYADKFSKMGYEIQILSTMKRRRKLFRVRVGHFETKAKALKQMKILEKKENKKFAVVKSK